MSTTCSCSEWPNLRLKEKQKKHELAKQNSKNNMFILECHHISSLWIWKQVVKLNILYGIWTAHWAQARHKGKRRNRYEDQPKLWNPMIICYIPLSNPVLQPYFTHPFLLLQWSYLTVLHLLSILKLAWVDIRRGLWGLEVVRLLWLSDRALAA